MRQYFAALFGLAAVVGPVRADPPPLSPAVPRPIPLTRPEMKEYLEQMKARALRIPLPELTEDEKQKLGGRGGYEARLRFHYMPGGGDGRGGGGGAFGFGGEKEGGMTLDYAFKTQMFWIVCRTNNCQYCQGHQESKLLRAGLTEDQIAALDGDWSGFTAAERAAFAFARRITYEPHRFTDADVAGLRPHYTDLQILEMIMSVAGNNAINRWKEGAGVPQNEGGGGFGKGGEKAAEPAREKHTYLTPTSEKYKTAVSKVAPLEFDAKGQPTRATVNRRPAPEPRADAEKALAAARTRTPRLPLVEDAKARAILPDDWAAGPLPQWVRLLANFPTQGKARILSQRSAETKGDLTPLLKAQASWIIARQDRAWYAAGEAKRRLSALGQTDDQVYGLDGDWAGFTPRERALFTVARNLAASPVVLTDDEVAAAVKLAGPRDVVQLINYVTVRASFDRITEAAGLQLEP
ncbi:carboxymuconolactone decarboxylase family protein [bacterium]|nr:carboxymuconolactone decarboxylase family protein [bacterium]